MRTTNRKKQYLMIAAGLIFCAAVVTFPALLSAQELKAPQSGGPNFQLPERPRGKPIVIEKEDESLKERMQRQITLDVREMNILDVVKFLSLKGNFNMVTSGNIDGRVTLYLKNVTIVDALDIILIANDLAYYIERGIVHVLTGAEYESMFGKKFNDKMKVSIVHLDYAKPSYVLAALENIKSGLGRLIIDEDTGSVVMIDTPEALSDMREALVEMEVPQEVFTYPLQYAKADVVAEKLSARVDANGVGSITTDERSNQIVIRAQPGRAKEVEQMIKRLDRPTKAVLVDAKVLQITFKPQYDFGIDWDVDFSKFINQGDYQKGSLSEQFLDEANLSTSNNLFSSFGKIKIGTLADDGLEVKLRALKQVSDTRILSNPKLLVTNNQEAKIHVGDTVPYIISTTSGTGDNAITSEEVKFVDVGLRLNVTPTINDDGYVTMLLNPEISTVTTRISSQGGGIPQVNKTEVETSILVKDGDTVILGGLKKDNKIHIEKGVPGLMKIPWIGQAFRSTSDTIESTEIVIFITPHIVTPGVDSLDMHGEIKQSRLTEEDIKKLKFDQNERPQPNEEVQNGTVVSPSRLTIKQ